MDLLRMLLVAQGAVIAKETLLVKVWGPGAEGENYVEVYFSFLRKKLTHIRSKVEIVAVRGAGYHLQERRR